MKQLHLQTVKEMQEKTQGRVWGGQAVAVFTLVVHHICSELSELTTLPVQWLLKPVLEWLQHPGGRMLPSLPVSPLSLLLSNSGSSCTEEPVRSANSLVPHVLLSQRACVVAPPYTLPWIHPLGNIIRNRKALFCILFEPLANTNTY